MAKRLAEGRVLAAGLRQHGDEPPAALVQVGHVLGGGQLAVGHVEEVAAAGQFAKQLPGLLVRLVVDRVAAFGAEVDRHAAIVAEREDVEQLLQVRAMVLVVAPGDCQGGPAAAGALFGRIGVVAVEGDRGGVVVQLLEGHVELADRVPDDGQDERRLFAAEQPVQRPPHAVVVEAFQLLGASGPRDPGRSRRPTRRCRTGLARDQQVAHQHQQGLGRGDLHPLVLRRQVLLEELFQAKPLENTVDDGQGSHLHRTQGLPTGAGQSAGTGAFAATVGRENVFVCASQGSP